MVEKFVTHSSRVGLIAQKYGWHPGARYTNLRDVRRFDRVGFLDIDWKDYNFDHHLRAAELVRPRLTVARDIEEISSFPIVIEQAYKLAQYSDRVIVVPKDPKLMHDMNEMIPHEFLLGYSVPSNYGATSIPPAAFRRPVHLLGGRPDVQRALADQMSVESFDCNRFTLDAEFGDYFDGSAFRPHPIGGYERCLEDSISNITSLWLGYDATGGAGRR